MSPFSTLTLEPTILASVHTASVHSALPLPEPKASSCTQNFVHGSFQRVPAFSVVSPWQTAKHADFYRQVLCRYHSQFWCSLLGGPAWGVVDTRVLNGTPPRHCQLRYPSRPSAVICGSPASLGASALLTSLNAVSIFVLIY